MAEQTPAKVDITPTGVRGVDLYRFPFVKDPRGDLTAGELENEFPFRLKRYFNVSGVPSGEIRAEHAHKHRHQFRICADGQCSVPADDRARCLEVVLNRPSIGIYVPPMIWGRHWQYSADAAFLVFTSELYERSDYIRGYDAFLNALRADG